jgi:FkbM family methyltransferase
MAERAGERPRDDTGFRARLLERAGRVSRRMHPSRTKARAGRALAYLSGDPGRVRCDVDGIEFVLRPADRVAGEAFWNGEYDDGLVSLLAALLEPSTVFADVGANVGLIGLRIASRLRRLCTAEPSGAGLRGRVQLFEPVPANVALIEASLARNPELAEFSVVLPIGLSDTAARLPIHVEGRGDRSGNAALKEPLGAERGRTTVVAEFDRLDDVLDSHQLPAPTLMKLDVEGAELACLRGAVSTLRHHRPVIFGEFNTDLMPLYGSSFLDSWALLETNGYRIFGFESDRSLRQKPPEAKLGDVLLVPHHRLGSVRELLERAGIELHVES